MEALSSTCIVAFSRMENSDPGAGRSRFEDLLEGFVISELEKQCARSTQPAQISHYRDKDKVDVQFMLERGP